MANPKTPKNPYGGGRVLGQPMPHLVRYPGILREIRFKYCQMKAQAKFRNEVFTLTWEKFQEMWEGRWHQRGRESNSLCMTRIDWDAPWDSTNTIIVERIEHLRLQAAHGVKKRQQLRALV